MGNTKLWKKVKCEKYEITKKRKEWEIGNSEKMKIWIIWNYKKNENENKRNCDKNENMRNTKSWKKENMRNTKLWKKKWEIQNHEKGKYEKYEIMKKKENMRNTKLWKKGKYEEYAKLSFSFIACFFSSCFSGNKLFAAIFFLQLERLHCVSLRFAVSAGKEFYIYRRRKTRKKITVNFQISKDERGTL